MTTASFTAPVGENFVVRLYIESQINASDNAFSPDNASSGSNHILSFVNGAPVFDLPAGYTACSPSSGSGLQTLLS